ncbi:MAG: hypothetical protein V4807_29870 [Burkholderia gladioli]
MENKENPARAAKDAAQGKEQREELDADILRAGVAMSARETVGRFGTANAEYIKGYTGVDNETGKTFAKGLKAISKHKINADPREAEKNIKQQAGYSAEVATTSRDNAESIIKGSKVRTMRSDDHPEYGSNHTVVDRVQVIDGHIIEGSQSQMKFVGNRDELFSKIAREDGKFARYRGVKLELPSEQYADAKAYCEKQAAILRNNAEHAEQAGKPEVAAKLRREASNYEELGENVRDSGLTTEEAIFYRQHPELATIRDIARTSHRAGMEGAKYGAIIGGSVSLLKNAFAVVQKEKKLGDAAVEIAQDVAKSGALGYGTAFAGAATKAVMQQSSRAGIRALANTSAPTLVVNVCLSLGTSVKKYVCGEITESQLLIEVGDKGAGMLSSGMMAALGQIAIPIPFVGAAIGGMLGYTLSSIFYQNALDAARGADLSRERLERVRAIEAAARAQLAQAQAELAAFMAQEMPQLHAETQQLFLAVDTASGTAGDALAAAVNQYAGLLGKQLQFTSQTELDAFMASDEPLRL